MDKLVLEDEKAEDRSSSPDKIGSSGEPQLAKELPRRLCELLAKTEPVVSGVFAAAESSEFGFGELLPIPPNNAAYTYTVAYLLTWKLILRFVGKAKNELRPRYVQ